MSKTLFKNIGKLVNVRDSVTPLRGMSLSELPVLHDAWLMVEDGFISAFGQMSKIPANISTIENPLDLTGRLMLPCWCDSHTHLVFSEPREGEFVDKIQGISYAEIAARGGGILNSAKKLSEIAEDQLFNLSWKRLGQVRKMGTGAIEIKSGYGLSTESELKMLRVIKRLKEKSGMLIKSTFLGAHAYPLQYKNDHQQYIRVIIEEMLPRISADRLADYVDVFCERDFFSNEETEQVCHAAKAHGLKVKLHANQLSSSGAVQTGVKLGALSVDHLENMDDDAITTLSNSHTIGTMLPTAAFFLRMQYPPVRRLIESGAALALATDYNPGSSPSGNMNLAVAIACIQMKMLPEEAINAATFNGACAMEVQKEAGAITKGKKANLIITEPVPSLAYLPYSFGENWIGKVMINGDFV